MLSARFWNAFLSLSLSSPHPCSCLLPFLHFSIQTDCNASLGLLQFVLGPLLLVNELCQRKTMFVTSFICHYYFCCVGRIHFSIFFLSHLLYLSFPFSINNKSNYLPITLLVICSAAFPPPPPHFASASIQLPLLFLLILEAVPVPSVVKICRTKVAKSMS